jgi:AbrB family looped-hinge helix DNA binding protein
MSTATITSKGQVTIPTDVRATFNLNAGDKLIFVPEGNRIIVIPVRRRPISDFAGIFRTDKPLPDMEELRRLYREETAARIMREGMEE